MGADRPFKEIVEEYLASSDMQLPPFDKTAFQIQQEITKAEPSIQKVESLVEVDQALTAQMLKMANTAFFRGLSKVETVRDTIVRLGLQQVSHIVMLVTQKKIFKSKDAYIQELMEKLWRHSVGTAMGSAWLAKKCGYHQLTNQAFVAGLLHDIGKLFLLTVIELVREEKGSDFDPSKAFFIDVMDNLHTDQGYALTQNWNLPEAYCIVARDHHTDNFDSRNVLLLMVRVVDRACNKMGIGMVEPTDHILVTLPEAAALGLSEVALAELEIMLEDAPILIV